MRFITLTFSLLAAAVVGAAVVPEVDPAVAPARDQQRDRDRDRNRNDRGRAREVPLLKLYGIPGITSSSGTSSFTAVGVPGRCQNFPDNITGFDRADAAYGYSCYIYTEKNCRGSSLNVETPLPQAQIFGGGGRPKRPTYQSWKCTSLTDGNFPPY